METEVVFADGVLTARVDGLVILTQPYDEFGNDWASEADAVAWGEAYLDNYLNPPVLEDLAPEIIEAEIVEEETNA